MVVCGIFSILVGSYGAILARFLGFRLAVVDPGFIARNNSS